MYDAETRSTHAIPNPVNHLSKEESGPTGAGGRKSWLSPRSPNPLLPTPWSGATR